MMNKKGIFFLNPMIIFKLAVVLVLAFGCMWIGRFAASHISFLNASAVGWTSFIVLFIIAAKIKLV